MEIRLLRVLSQWDNWEVGDTFEPLEGPNLWENKTCSLRNIIKEESIQTKYTIFPATIREYFEHI